MNFPHLLLEIVASLPDAEQDIVPAALRMFGVGGVACLLLLANQVWRLRRRR